ncbi:hypothetical protein F4604DRAFT_1882302 [Suillus subluteus]|nr:hypothetical protein F4604DRAFT_1882302 [Suillus subluteus]
MAFRLVVQFSMSNDENTPSPDEVSHKTSSNPLILHGRHFGRTVFALCNYPALLAAGILQLEELQDSPLEDFPADVQQEHRVFMELLDSYPGLLDRLTNGEEEDIIHMGDLLGKGASGAQGDNTKTLRSAVLEWLVPRGQAVIPPLSQNIKSDRGFNHKATGALLCPTGLDWLDAETKQSLKSGETTVHGDQWPMFLYAGYIYNSEDPWKGLLRSKILIFITTRSSNAYLHGMKCVTKGSLAYIAMQIWFSLSSSSVFSQTNTITDSKNFYHTILDLLEDPDESEEVGDLMTWWTRWVFPNSSSSQCSISKNSALSKIQEKCAALQERTIAGLH